MGTRFHASAPLQIGFRGVRVILTPDAVRFRIVFPVVLIIGLLVLQQLIPIGSPPLFAVFGDGRFVGFVVFPLVIFHLFRVFSIIIPRIRSLYLSIIGVVFRSFDVNTVFTSGFQTEFAFGRFMKG